MLLKDMEFVLKVWRCEFTGCELCAGVSMMGIRGGKVAVAAV
jgi:hypothetical protein